MPPQSRRFYTLRPYLQTDADQGGGGANPPATPPENNEGDGELGDKGKAALDAERSARKAAEREAKDAKAKLAEIETAAAKRAEEEAAEQGKWQELATTREATLKETTTERDRLAARVEALEALAVTRLTDLTKDLPAEFKALLPGEDVPIEQRLAQAEKVVKAAGVKAAESRGNGPNPKPAGTTKPDIKGVLARRQYIN